MKKPWPASPEPGSALAKPGVIVHFIAMSTRDWRRASSQPTLFSPWLRQLPPSQLRKMKRKEQVAAVCFRIGSRGVEFLLIRTDRGRWTFPKGGSESGLTHAQAAALEAFEEAGVHGRIEEASFTTYIDRKSRGKRDEARKNDIAIHAHLCEVFRHTQP